MSKLFKKNPNRNSTDILLSSSPRGKEAHETPYYKMEDAEEETGDDSVQMVPKLKPPGRSYQRILLVLTIIAVLLGLMFGLIISYRSPGEPWLGLIGLPGLLYIRMLKCLIVPLISLALVGAMGNLGSIQEGRIGLYAVSWFISTTVLGGTMGLAWVTLYHPWDSFTYADIPLPLPLPTDSSSEEVTNGSVAALLRQLFTDNILSAALEMNMLGIITFSCVFGLVIATLEKERSTQLLYLVESLRLAMQKIVNLIIWLSPIGVMSLISYHMGKSGDYVGVMTCMALLVAARFSALLVHGFVVLPFVFFCITRKNPYPILRDVSQIWISAFSANSSAATLSVTTKTVEENLHVSTAIARFVCATGCTVNMGGSCISYTITTLCMARVIGMDINFAQMMAVVYTSTLISIGAAAIPSTGITNYMAVMAAIGLPLDNVIPILSLVLSITWLEDRIMAVVNVEGDVLAATTIHHIVNKENKI